MNFDFTPDQHSLYIPKEAYRPVKRCPFCHSVYISDTKCETCQRALDFDLIGQPFSYKSGYQLKERYIKSMPLFDRFFPSFENKKSKEAKSLIRNLEKRLRDLCLGFSTPGMIQDQDRKLFYIESKYIVDELIDYDVHLNLIEKIIAEHLEEQILLQDLLTYAKNAALNRPIKQSSSEIILSYRFFGVLRLEFLLKFGITMAAIVYAAIKFKSL